MRYYILFSVVFCLLQLCLSQPHQNPATPAVLQAVKQFNDKYTFSLIPDGASMAIFWTPDITNSKIKFGIMGGESSYVGFGFNDQPVMGGARAVISGNSLVQLYTLGEGYVLSPETNQSNIQDITLQELDNWIFSEFTWVLAPPFYWNITSTTNFVWSTRQADSQPFLSYHDNRGAFSGFSFTKSAISQGFTDASSINCNNGVSSTFFPFLGDSCTCVPGFTVKSNCSVSNLPFSHVFTAIDGSTIATMYWSMNGSVANFVVQSIPNLGNGWTGIAFAGDISGAMGPSDAVVYPVKSSVEPFFLEGEGETTAAKITITSTSSTTLKGINYFSFTRNFSDPGGVLITDYTSVPMIAATCPGSLWPHPHSSNQRSSGADLINLLTGTSKEGPFVWTKFTTHGFLMWLSWGIIIPCGFLWARFVKGYPNDKSALWFEGHRTLMSLGFVLVIVSAIYAVGLAGSHLDSTHKILGATVVACALYQVMSAVMRPHADPTNPSPQRLVFEYTHHFVGRSTIIISWVTICYGMMLVHGISMSVVWGHVALSVIWLVAALVLEIRKAIITRRNREYESLNRR